MCFCRLVYSAERRVSLAGAADISSVSEWNADSPRVDGGSSVRSVNSSLSKKLGDIPPGGGYHSPERQRRRSSQQQQQQQHGAGRMTGGTVLPDMGVTRSVLQTSASLDASGWQRQSRATPMPVPIADMNMQFSGEEGEGSAGEGWDMGGSKDVMGRSSMVNDGGRADVERMTTTGATRAADEALSRRPKAVGGGGGSFDASVTQRFRSRQQVPRRLPRIEPDGDQQSPTKPPPTEGPGGFPVRGALRLSPVLRQRARPQTASPAANSRFPTANRTNRSSPDPVTESQYYDEYDNMAGYAEEYTAQDSFDSSGPRQSGSADMLQLAKDAHADSEGRPRSAPPVRTLDRWLASHTAAIVFDNGYSNGYQAGYEQGESFLLLHTHSQASNAMHAYMINSASL